MSAEDPVNVGRYEVAVDTARSWVATYLNDAPLRFAYPSYDDYATNGDANRLCDGDLLAPVLLNVDVPIEAFAGLRAIRKELEAALVVVPRNVDIIAASNDAIELVGNLYSILDSEELRPRLVQGVTLAKVLHRKRPDLIPLYDQNVDRVYRGEDAPILPAKDRSWVEFMRLLAEAMRNDLNSRLEVWDELTRLAPADGPRVSRLRALDIVAWHLGKSD
jgi:hypothetical protein